MSLTNRAFTILRDQGPRELGRRSKEFLLRSRRTFTIRSRLNGWQNKLLYDAPPDPFRPITIDPTAVECKSSVSSRKRGLGQTVGGDWDTEETLRPVEDLTVVRGLEQRFEERKEWENTIYYESAKAKIQQRGYKRGYSSMDEFLDVRCAYVDELFESIRDEGYRPNFTDSHQIPSGDTGNYTGAQNLEPIVVIGREGEIYWKDGFHRLAIARILSIESIPVHVLVRHRQWQEFRDDIHGAADKNGFDETVRTHPDLQDIRP